MVQQGEKEADGVKAVVMMEGINQVLPLGRSIADVISVAKGCSKRG